jgi:hypothetical protein
MDMRGNRPERQKFRFMFMRERNSIGLPRMGILSGSRGQVRAFAGGEGFDEPAARIGWRSSSVGPVRPGLSRPQGLSSRSTGARQDPAHRLPQHWGGLHGGPG